MVAVDYSMSKLGSILNMLKPKTLLCIYFELQCWRASQYRLHYPSRKIGIFYRSDDETVLALFI